MFPDILALEVFAVVDHRSSLDGAIAWVLLRGGIIDLSKHGGRRGVLWTHIFVVHIEEHRSLLLERHLRVIFIFAFILVTRNKVRCLNLVVLVLLAQVFLARFEVRIFVGKR